MQANRGSRVRKVLSLIILTIDPILNIKRFVYAFPRYILFLRDLFKYVRMPNSEPIHLLDLHPILHDKNESAGVGGESFYQNSWAFKRIYQSKPPLHIDVGSNTLFLGMLSAITKVIVIDIRPFPFNLDGLEFKQGDILHLPYEDDTVDSLSCLHTVEHIGLGRYGDSLDPKGSAKAIRELQRILAPQGNLYFAVPIGRQRVSFNQHRVFSPRYIIDQFDQCQLIELSGMCSNNALSVNVDMLSLSNIEYSLGLFHFKKKALHPQKEADA